MEWTDGRIRSFITTVLRSGMRRWPPKWNVLKSSATTKQINKSSGRMAQHYRCAKCKGEFSSTGVQVDHKHPAVDPKVGFVSWDEFIKRLFVKESQLQTLCKACHKKKTKKEQQKRNEDTL